ncbi:MAG: FAD-dependent oxidoreductase [Mesorhizobium sp.]|nr:FAD-dependent oxidoreductase [Mesorhizobium sp.]
MTQAVRNALVIGGGFSGMSAAIEMRKRGIEVDLVEIDPGWRSYGAGITLGGATFRAFRQLGVLDAFLRRGSATDGLDICALDGTLVAKVPTPRLAGPDVPGSGGIMRPALAAILAEATKAAGTQVFLATSFERITADAGGVTVALTNGNTRRYDLVIGADGLFSKVREAVFPDAPRPTYTGQCVWRAVVDRPAEIETAVMWLGPKVKVGINPVSDNQAYIFVTVDQPTKQRLAPGDYLRVLKELLEPFSAPLVVRLREELTEASSIVYRPLEALLLPRPWHRGRVVLIGDAVHATTPHLASGACIGIEDAIVLAEELERASEVEAGLSAFEERRWERCRMVVENSLRLGEIEISNGDKQEHAAIMRNSIMALAAPI